MPDKDKDEKIHIIPVRMPHSMWVALRHMQEDGHIRSLQRAAIQALKRFINYYK